MSLEISTALNTLFPCLFGSRQEVGSSSRFPRQKNSPLDRTIDPI